MGMLEGMLALALATSTPAPLAGQDAAMERGQARTIAWREQLLHSSRPRDRALGASFFALESSMAPGRGAALRQAARALPSDVLVQTLWVSASNELSGCTPTDPCPERAEALAHADPDNGRGWAHAAVLHYRAGNVHAGDAALHRAASSAYFRQPIAAAIAAWIDALERYPQPPWLADLAPARAAMPHPVESRRAYAMALSYMAMFFPVYDLTSRCKPGDGAPPARVADCRAVGERMMASNSLLEQHLGRALASAASGGEYASQDRRLKWFRAASAEANRDGIDEQYFADLVSTDSEIRAIELSLQRRGLPLEPPADWSYERWESDWLAKAAAAPANGAAASTDPGDR